MLNDKFGNPIYQEKDLLELIYQNVNNFDNLYVEETENIQQLKNFAGITFKQINNNFQNIEEFDCFCQQEWFLPEEYKNMDIESYLIYVCPKENYQRLIEELQEFRSRNMIVLLKVLKYIVDTFRKNNILWGVGRGSSVSSYVLFLLGVHKIDSIKYKLDWQEFLR